MHICRGYWESDSDKQGQGKQNGQEMSFMETFQFLLLYFIFHFENPGDQSPAKRDRQTTRQLLPFICIAPGTWKVLKFKSVAVSISASLLFVLIGWERVTKWLIHLNYVKQFYLHNTAGTMTWHDKPRHLMEVSLRFRFIFGKVLSVLLCSPI